MRIRPYWKTGGHLPSGWCVCTDDPQYLDRKAKKGVCRFCHKTRQVECPKCCQGITGSLREVTEERAEEVESLSGWIGKWICIGCSEGAIPPDTRARICLECQKDLSGLNHSTMCYECQGRNKVKKICEVCSSPMMGRKMCPTCKRVQTPKVGRLDSSKPARGGRKSVPPPIATIKDELSNWLSKNQKSLRRIDGRIRELEKKASALRKEANHWGAHGNYLKALEKEGLRDKEIKEIRNQKKRRPALLDERRRLLEKLIAIGETQTYPVDLLTKEVIHGRR